MQPKNNDSTHNSVLKIEANIKRGKYLENIPPKYTSDYSNGIPKLL